MFAAYLLLFVVVVNVIRTPAQVKRIIGVLTAVGIWEVLAGISQLPIPRISGTFVNHNHFAGYLEMIVSLSLGLLFAQLESHTIPTRNVVTRWIDDKYLKIILLVILTALLFVAVAFSGSRGGMLSLLGGIALLSGLAYSRRLLRKWVKIIIVCAVVMFCLTLLVRPESIWRRFGALTTTTEANTLKDRLNVWKDSIAIMRGFPVVGSGVGTFAHLFQRYQTFPSERWFTHAENDYVQLFTEAGMIGMAILVWATVSYGVPTWRAWKKQHSRWSISIGVGGFGALFSMILHSAGDFNLHIPANAIVFTVIAGLTYVVVHFQRKEAQGHTPKHPLTADIRSESSGEGEPSVVCLTSDIRLRLPRFGVYGLLLIATVCVLSGIVAVTRTFSAVLSHKNFRTMLAFIEQGYASDENHHIALSSAQQAIASDSNNADYHFALGSYLYRHAFDDDRQGDVEASRQSLDDAEFWLRNAVMLAPSNPWYYYELGNVGLARGECQPSLQKTMHATKPCKTVEYYHVALHNAPMNYFLRRNAGRWLYDYDQEIGLAVLEELRQHTYGTEPASHAQWNLQIGRLLYDLQLDMVSDEYANRAGNAALAKDFECMAVPLDYPILRPIEENNPGQEVVFGNDDGTPEWRTHLYSDTMRIRKDICLPDDVQTYTTAALKILMNNGANGAFTARFFIDDHLVKTYSPLDPVPRIAAWYEMPVDLELLRDRPMVSVYIRVSGVSNQGNYLQVWGDGDTPNADSVLNFDRTEDLSFHEGIQSGEYMVQLVLRK